MDKYLQAFSKKLLFFSIIIALVGYALSFILPGNYITSEFYFIVIFFFAVTYISHRVLMKSLKGRPNKFVNIYMLLTVGKLIFFLLILLIYIFIYREHAIVFAITFMIMYLLFAAFELSNNMKLARNRFGNREAEKN